MSLSRQRVAKFRENAIDITASAEEYERNMGKLGRTHRGFLKITSLAATVPELAVVLIISAALLPMAKAAKPGAGRIVVSADQPTGELIRPVWTRLNIFDLTRTPDRTPAPFIREVILMTATGGRETCEMFGLDAQGRPAYDFSKIDWALDRIIKAGLHPTVVIGNTPEALSTLPGEKGKFNANVGEPKDYRLYYNYIKALFTHLVQRYGRERVESWDYRLMTEPDNQDWWVPGWPEYQKLYDYTLAAARSACPGIIIDGGNVAQPNSVWTRNWAQWAASNSRPHHHPGALPRKVRGVSFSCYTTLSSRHQMGADPRELTTITRKFRKDSEALGKVMVSVDEGLILHDEHYKRLWLGDGTELGAAWNAAIFKLCHDADIHRFVQWGFHSDGVKSPSYNVAMMYERMLAASRLKVEIKGLKKLPRRSYVDAIASKDNAGNVRLIAFHYNPNRRISRSCKLSVVFQGLEKGSYTLNHWRVDRGHSNFFTKWLKDSRDLPRYNSGSVWDMMVTSPLRRAGRKFWKSRKDRYLKIDDLELLEPSKNIRIAGRFSRTISLPANSVSLIELLKK